MPMQRDNLRATGVRTGNRPRLPWAPTRPFWLALALVLFVLVATNNTGVNLLYLALGMMVGTLVISVFVSSWSLRHLVVERDFGDHAIAGEPVHVEYRFRKTGGGWPAMAMHFREIHADLAQAPWGFILHLAAGGAGRGGSRRRAGVPLPQDDAGAKLMASLVARRRGLLKLDVLEVSTTFPFGFIRRTKRLHVPQELVVYPRIGVLNRRLAMEYREAVDAAAMTSNRRGGNDEFYGIREYRDGDNVRAIHWRSSARTGQLMIREMAANAPPQLIVVLNLRTWKQRQDSLEIVEQAIELAAALVCYGFYENFAVGLAVAGAEGDAGLPPAPHMGRVTRAELLRQLAVIDPLAIKADGGIELPNRVAGRAEWVVVTMHGDDPIRDLLPPVGAAHVASPGGGGGGGGHRTLLPLDSPEARTWVHFLTPEDTMRLLRDRSV